MTIDNLERRDGVTAGLISFEGDNETVDGYFARPDDDRPLPGVVLIQEYWGLEPHIKTITERLAREGFVVVAPDLYHGEVAQSPDQAKKDMMMLDKEHAVEEIGHAIDYLQSREDVQPKRLGVVGFCMGGLLTWKTAEREGNTLGAIAPFYASRYAPSAEDMAEVGAPALIVYGEHDQSISESDRNKVIKTVEEAGKPHKVLLYDAGHAFMNDTKPSYQPEAADAAWKELLAWFREHLR